MARTAPARAKRYGDSRRQLRGIPFLLLALFAGSPLQAADLWQQDGWDLRWDNTLRYTVALRLVPYSGALASDPNTDDGDRNFAPGLISDRLDWISEFDLSRGPFGIDVSATAWYDTAYHGKNANDSPATFNPWSVPHDRFTRATETLMGEDADLLNAFAHASFNAAGMPVFIRIGRHTLLWGESLFFADNGIAAGQAPIDAIKAVSEPEAEAKELFLPVGQASATIQPTADISLSIYDQFEWRRTRLPAAGSYFSDADFLDAGGERIIIAPGQYLYRTPDVGGTASGQYGAAMHVTLGETDYGFYALRFNAKEPEVFAVSLPSPPPNAENVGDYWLVFPHGIDAYGASFNTSLGDSALAGEVSVRRNMPLVSQTLFALPGGGGGGYGGTGYAAVHPPAPPFLDALTYAAGNTVQAQVSTVETLSPGPLWQSADLSAEVAANDLLGITAGAAQFDRGRDRFAAAIRAVLEPHYYQVLPSLDISTPLGLGYDPIGNSSENSSMEAGAGDVEIGVSATWRTVWEGSLTFTHYFGSPQRQPFADRDFISLSVERTF